MENKTTNTTSLTKGKVFALLGLIVFALAFIFACLKNVLKIGSGLVGTFGVMIYPALLVLSLLCLAKFLGFKYRRSVKATALLFCFILSVLFIVHCLFPFSVLDGVATGKTLKTYISLPYSRLTVLGSFGSVITGVIAFILGGFGTIVLFGILATLMIGLFIDYELYGKYEQKHIKKLKTRTMREKVSRSDENVVDGSPDYSFSEENSTYTESDVAHEVTSNEVYENSVTETQTTYTENDVAHQIEENPEQYANQNYNYAETTDYSNVNFFGGNPQETDYNNQNYTGTYTYQENPFGVDAVDNSHVFSYKQEEYPNVFTDSMDEYRRKFMQDTFGNLHGEPTEQSGTDSQTVGYETPQSAPVYPQSTPVYPQSEPVSPEAPKPVQISSEPERYYVNPVTAEPVKPENSTTYDSHSTDDEFKTDFNFGDDDDDTFVSEPSTSDEPTSSLPSFEELFGNSNSEEKEETPSGSTFNFGTDSNGFTDEDLDDAEAENQGVYGMNFTSESTPTTNTSTTSSTSSDFDLDNFLSFPGLNTEAETPQTQEGNHDEITDFGFLRAKEEDNNYDTQRAVQNDVGEFNTLLYPENKVETPNSNLTVTSVNPIDPPKVTVQAKEPQPKKFSGYNIGMSGIRYNPPPLSLLKPSKIDTGDYSEEQQRKSNMLEDALKAFNIPAKVVNIIRGPKITRYELSVPLGVPVKKIPMYELDIKRALAAKTINIQAPIPGSSYVGIELENDTFTSVSQRELLESEAYQNCKDPLPIAVGKDISGEIVVKSLAKMVHLLIAGSTGSGKSVFIHSLVMSLIYRHSPEDLRLIMIDPKKVEFNRYNGLPHLLTPEVVMGADKAINALKWCVKEMDRRYDLMSKSGYNNIEPYNKSELVKAGQFEKFPYIVIIVDELAEIMMVNKKEVEGCIQRITQLARACGMHLVLATQRPSVDIISGVIKNNVPSRIAFSLSSGIDSKTILNTVGAEKLLGQGDMLFSPNGTASMPRLQAAYCSDEEIKAVIDYDKQNNSANFDEDVENVINSEQQSGDEYANQTGDAPAPRELDSYFKVAVKLVMQNGGASTSYLQRRLSVGYSRAAKIMDQMEDKGYIAPATGSKIRKVLITPDQFKAEFNEDYNDISDL